MPSTAADVPGLLPDGILSQYRGVQRSTAEPFASEAALPRGMLVLGFGILGKLISAARNEYQGLPP